MSTTAHERRRALAFLIGAGALLIGVAAVLGLRQLGRNERTYLAVFHESVAGLERTSKVEYMGVPVGVVRDIRLRPGTFDEVEVELGIEEEVPIKADMRAKLRSQGITGLLKLELVGGSPGAPPLPPGETIPGQPSLLATLTSTLADVSRVASDATGMTAEVSLTMAELRATLASAQEAAQAIAATATTLGDQAQQLGGALETTTERAGELLAEPAQLRGELTGAVQAIHKAMDELRRTSALLGGVAADNRADLRATIGALRRASAELHEAARQVRRSPSSLLTDRPTPEKPFPDPLPPPEQEEP